MGWACIYTSDGQSSTYSTIHSGPINWVVVSIKQVRSIVVAYIVGRFFMYDTTAYLYKPMDKGLITF